MDNELTGTIRIQIINTNGIVVKELNVQKANTGIMQAYISLNNLKAGTYFIRLQLKNREETKQIIKL